MKEQVDELNDKHTQDLDSAQTKLEKELNEKELLYLGKELKNQIEENEQMKERVESAEDEVAQMKANNVCHNYGSFRESFVGSFQESFVSVTVEN